MGWSALAIPCFRMEAISEACFASTGSSNSFKVGDKSYFYQVGREQADGAITGGIFQDLGETCCKAGTFRIEPNGKISRGPKFFKEVPFFHAEYDGILTRWRAGETFENFRKLFAEANPTLGPIHFITVFDEDGQIVKEWKSDALLGK